MKKTRGFLVITRKVGQSIILEDGTEIYLSMASRGQARIAIKTPSGNTLIRRKEFINNSNVIGSKDTAGDKMDVTASDSNPHSEPESNATTSGEGIQGQEPEPKPSPFFPLSQFYKALKKS